MKDGTVVEFPGTVRNRLANAAKEFARRTKDEEAIEAALFLEPSSLVRIEEVPADDERLRDFLVRATAVHARARPQSVRRVVIYVAEDAPQDLWFEAYALLAARMTRNVLSVEKWSQLLEPDLAVDLRALTGVAQFEALCFVERMFADLGLLQLADMVNFTRLQRAEKRRTPRGEGALALEFLNWCLEGGRLPEPHEDFRIHAAELLRFFLAVGRCSRGNISHVVSAISA